jgi:L-fuculose-phosphate aldolase
MTEADLRAEIVATAQAMDRAGFAPTKSGNVSARWEGGFLVTPSGLPYARMKPDDIVTVGLDGRARGPGKQIGRASCRERVS